MKPHTDIPPREAQPQAAAAAPSEVVAKTRAADLTAEERRVFEHLQGAASGLTLKQLQSRMEDASVDLETVLMSLVERQLVSRLNTLIPSYAYRKPDPIPLD